MNARRKFIAAVMSLPIVTRVTEMFGAAPVVAAAPLQVTIIPRTNLHVSRVLDQIVNNVVGLQRDMVRNAQTHKAMAVAQNPSVITLTTFVRDSAAAYQARAKFVTDWLADSTKNTTLVTQLSKRGWVATDITAPLTPLVQAMNALAGLKNNPTYAEIITACNAVLAAVDTPDSIWPE